MKDNLHKLPICTQSFIKDACFKFLKVIAKKNLLVFQKYSKNTILLYEFIYFNFFKNSLKNKWCRDFQMPVK